MKYLLTLTVALRGIFANKLRSFLTILGVIIGIGSIISMMAVGEGSEKSILQDISDVGSNTLWVEPGAGMMGMITGAPGSVRTLTYDDFLAMAESSDLPSVKNVNASATTRLQLIAGQENVNATVAGVPPEYLEFGNRVLARGEFFTQYDVESKAMVCVLGSDVAEDLFGETDPVGQRVRAKGRSLEVVGVLESDGMGTWTTADRQLMLPITTVMYRIDPQYSTRGDHLVTMISMEAVSANEVDDAVSQIKAFLRERHRLGPAEDDDFTVNILQNFVDMMTNTSDTLRILLRWTSALALLIAGIGIMNIMLISVTERTREIGIRKAVGAKRRHILVQFLLEATAISLIGGIIGIGAGYLAAEYAFNGLEVNQMGGLQEAPIEPIVSVSIVLWSFLVAVVVGIISGTYPAIRAARLNPIDALRYE